MSSHSKFHMTGPMAKTAMLAGLATLAIAVPAFGREIEPGDDRGGATPVAASPVSAAIAKGGVVRVSGTCTKASTAKLKLKPDNGRIEVEVEVDQNRNRVPWNVVIRRNGAIAAKVATITRAPSGSFSVHRLVTNGAGRDVIAATATRRGETCTVRAAF